MYVFRATVNFGDDTLRTYLVRADGADTAEECAKQHAIDLLSIVVDDHASWLEDYDDELTAPDFARNNLAERLELYSVRV